MFRRNGYTGTGVKQVAAAAGAQLGSLYHFFPGGKEQLAEEAIRTAGPLYGDLVYAILDPYQDLETAITDAFALAAQDLAASDYADACPIATIALEVASTNDHLRQATAAVPGRASFSKLKQPNATPAAMTSWPAATAASYRQPASMAPSQRLIRHRPWAPEPGDLAAAPRLLSPPATRTYSAIT